MSSLLCHLTVFAVVSVFSIADASGQANARFELRTLVSGSQITPLYVPSDARVASMFYSEQTLTFGISLVNDSPEVVQAVSDTGWVGLITVEIQTEDGVALQRNVPFAVSSSQDLRRSDLPPDLRVVYPDAAQEATIQLAPVQPVTPGVYRLRVSIAASGLRTLAPIGRATLNSGTYFQVLDAVTPEDQINIRYVKAIRDIQAGRAEQGRGELQQLTQVRPNNYVLWTQLANSFINDGDCARAKAAFQWAIAAAQRGGDQAAAVRPDPNELSAGAASRLARCSASR